MPSSRTADGTLPLALPELDEGLRRLQRLLSSRRVFSNLAHAAGVELSQQSVQVLRVLDPSDPRTVAEVAAAAQMDVGAVSRQLTALESLGFVRRSASPDHGSVVLVTATSRGARVASRIAEARRRHLHEALSGWSVRDRTELGRLLRRFVEDLQQTPYRAS